MLKKSTIIFLLCLIFITVSMPITYAENRWQLIGMTEDSVWYFDSATIKPLQDKKVLVWIRQILFNENKYHTKEDTTNVLLDPFEYTWKPLYHTANDKTGKQLKSEKLNFQWMLVAPDSITEQIMEKCTDYIINKKIKISSQKSTDFLN